MPRKIALLVGINYKGTSHALSGCINDVKAMQDLLKANGWECRIMTDEGRVGKRMYPERGNIVYQMQNLILEVMDKQLLMVVLLAVVLTMPSFLNGMMVTHLMRIELVIL